MCVAPIARVPAVGFDRSSESLRIDSISWSTRWARFTTWSPAGVIRVSERPRRLNIVKPSSVSSSRICLLMPGCDVCRLLDAAVMLRSLSAMATR